MKKFLVAILLFTYTLAASGASVELHYCMGKLIAWDFEYTSKNGCHYCGMATKDLNGCCDNKQLQIKVDKDQQAVYNNIAFSTDHFSIAPVYPNSDDLLQKVKIITQPSSHAPPLINNTLAYLRNCNFRI